MFDFGFSELVVIGVVLLIVVGPQRLPKVARTAGHVLGRLQRYVSDVKSDIQREMQLDELKKLQQQVQQQAHEMESSVRSGVGSLESDLARTVDDVKAAVPQDGTASSVVAEKIDSSSAPSLPDRGLTADPAAGPQLELGLDPARQGVPVDKA